MNGHTSGYLVLRALGRVLAAIVGFGVVGGGEASSGATWSTMQGGMDGNVRALTLGGDGRIYAGGVFTNAGITPASRIACWNGNAWTNLGTGTDGEVWAVSVDGAGNVVAGGDFTTAGGVAANRIAKWDGNTWTNIGSGMEGAVYALTFDGAGNLYAGGSFTTAGGRAANYVAKWNGSSWTNLGAGMHGTVLALASDGAGSLYVGGAFGEGLTDGPGAMFNGVAKWDGNAWTNLGAGVTASVKTLVLDGTGILYSVASWLAPDGWAKDCVAKWDGQTWTTLGGSGMDAPIYALALNGSGVVYAAGRFTNAGGVAANRLAKWNGGHWSAVGVGLDDGCGALAVTGATVYVGGQFTQAGGVPANHVARWQHLWAMSSDGGGGWDLVPWLGRFLDSGDGWIYHEELAWLYCVGEQTDSIWMWSPTRHWLWTGNGLYPFFWSNDLQTWLWYCVGSGTGSGGWFYNFGSQQWEWR